MANSCATAANSTSAKNDDDLSCIACRELGKGKLRGVSDTHLQIFQHIRSYICIEDGAGWSDGPDPVKKKAFLTFASNPASKIDGSPAELNLRPRYLLMTSWSRFVCVRADWESDKFGR